MLLNHEKEWLADKIKDHILNGIIMSEFDVNYFLTKLPGDCIFTGKAYRIVTLNQEVEASRSLKMNKCWSKSKDVIYRFLSEHKDSGLNTEFYKNYTSLIIGLDVNAVISYLEREGFSMSIRFWEEDEIIAFKIDDMLEI